MLIPINESVNAQTDLALSETYSEIEGFYFVSGFIYKNKTRLYSPPIASLFVAEQIYDEYIDILKSLNGGNVTLYKINVDDYEILAASFLLVSNRKVVIVLSKFNARISTPAPNTVTHEGAPAYRRDPVQAWFNMLFSSFLENRFYESSDSQIKRFIKLTDEVANAYGYAFVGKAAIFARNELGMRSISQLTAAWLNDKSFQEKRNFYRAFMRRPDDVAEIFAAVDFLEGKRSHALINGSRDYLSSLGRKYQLTKYKMSGHTYNMFDLINLTHPRSAAIDKYKRDMLSSPDTWEVNIATAENEEARSTEWRRMVEEEKLGYMALLKNLNNILSSGINNDWINTYLVPQLKNRQKIRKSLVFPYRIYTAYKNLTIDNLYVINALSEAFMIATENVPVFDGISAVILDVSGSMSDVVSNHSSVTLKEIGACFAVTLILNGSNVDFIKFGTEAKRKKYSSLANPFELIKKMCANEDLGYGTRIESAMKIMHTNYDRIFLISDMQVFDSNRYYVWGYYNTKIISTWIKTYKSIMTYSFDLGNYHSQIEPPSENFMFLTSLSDVILKYINLSEGSDNIIDIINQITF